MYKQGRSLGSQIARQCKPALDKIIRNASASGANVWFLGRDCMAVYSAYKKIAPNVRYLHGLNRECAGKLDHAGVLHRYLREIGIQDGDILVDSGFRGSIFDRIVRPQVLNAEYLRLEFYLLSADYDCDYASLNCKRSVILALEHSPKPEIVVWDPKARRPVVHKIPKKNARSYGDNRRECAAGLNQVSEFISGFVNGYNSRY
jgi:hypothetical protein